MDVDGFWVLDTLLINGKGIGNNKTGLASLNRKVEEEAVGGK